MLAILGTALRGFARPTYGVPAHIWTGPAVPLAGHAALRRRAPVIAANSDAGIAIGWTCFAALIESAGAVATHIFRDAAILWTVDSVLGVITITVTTALSLAAVFGTGAPVLGGQAEIVAANRWTQPAVRLTRAA